MVQSINLKALTTLASVVRRPYLAAPHVAVSNISEVNYQALRDHCNIKAVIFDKDNTLTAPYINSIHPNAHFGLQSALDVFGSKNVAILSNSAGTDDDFGHEDAKSIEERLGIPVILHKEKKPGGLEEVMLHFPNVKEPSELCMVGDRILTDVVFGNLHGMLTVHTLPLCTGEDNKGDNKIASWIRSAENKLMYGNWWGGRKIRENVLEHKWWRGQEECPLVIATRSEKELGSLFREEKKNEL
ncbi:hypothetical protein ACHAW6_015693 [Cyclotella cf. meneghiniana]